VRIFHDNNVPRATPLAIIGVVTSVCFVGAVASSDGNRATPASWVFAGISTLAFLAFVAISAVSLWRILRWPR
jgi:flavin reductase (DIM6/NTAB) family NADH-FMN oxidoreductase RutF